jgi:D-proline reductase (dithiol) PrdB
MTTPSTSRPNATIHGGAIRVGGRSRHRRPSDVVISHLHIDTRAAESDLDVVLPMRRLTELAADGVVGDSSPRHFSIMGYILDAADLTRVTAPQLAAALADDNVDLALLVPV